MKRKLFAQLGIFLVVGLLLTACQSNEGSVSTDDPDDFVVRNLALGLPVFTEIVNPVYSRTSTDLDDVQSDTRKVIKDIASLLSYDPDAAVLEGSNPSLIFKSNSTVANHIMVALNTIDDNSGRSEITVLVRDDSVYKIDHLTGEIRLLRHFVHRVCEVIPVDVVQTETSNTGLTVTHTVLNGDFVYVMTAEDDNCFESASVQRFYRLPLNYRFNSDELDASTTNEFTVVSESLARAQLVFGWVPDEQTADPDDQRLDYGYLGYGLLEQKLRFFDAEFQQLWSQSRTLQTFPVVNLEFDVYSPEYLATLTELEDYQYALQLGLDIFVFDSSTALFAKKFDETDSILTDRTFTMAAKTSENDDEILQAVTMRFDDDEVVFIDDDKIFRYDYSGSIFDPTPINDKEYKVKRQPALDVNTDHGKATIFSQFDLMSCSKATDEAACRAAHDLDPNDPLSDGNWQFIVDCTAATGCDLTAEVADLCATAAELLLDPNAGQLCTPSDYRHLSELNEVANDAEFRGFIKYSSEGYIRDMDFILNQDSLYITARMLEKDILLRYFYNVDLSQARPSRESVLFGERVQHFGIDAYISQNNLFVTTLMPDQVRHNECYKNYQRVSCESCSAEDFSEGVCTDRFIEYDSLALFCPAADIDSGACTDDSLAPNNSLSVESAGENAKWIELHDFTSSNAALPRMHLLKADASNVIDEGVLVNSELVPVDNSSGSIIPANTMGIFESPIEAVAGGRISDAAKGRVDVIETEVIQKDTDLAVSATSRANVYFLANPKSGAGSATKAADTYYLRPITK